MFNPFDDDINEAVIKEMKLQLLVSDLKRVRYLICYGGVNIDAVNNSGIFSLMREGYCPYRGNAFRVFKFNGYE